MDNFESVSSNDLLPRDGFSKEDVSLSVYETEISGDMETQVETETLVEPTPVYLSETSLDGVYSKLDEVILLLTILVFMSLLKFAKQTFATWRNNMKGRS